MELDFARPPGRKEARRCRCSAGRAAWFGVALSASLIFILTESLEFILAERMQERRAEPTEQG